jgi:DNA sulfur modification protein DndC
MIRELISIEKKFASMTRRSGLLDELEKAIKRSFYEDRDDAIEYAREKHKQEQLVLGASEEDPLNEFIETLIDEPKVAK